VLTPISLGTNFSRPGPFVYGTDHGSSNENWPADQSKLMWLKELQIANEPPHPPDWSRSDNTRGVRTEARGLIP